MPNRTTAQLRLRRALNAHAPDDRAKVSADIERKAKTFKVPMLTLEQREKQLAEIEAQLVEMEYLIELGYRAAKAEGHDVVRPPRMSIESILQIVVDTSSRKRAPNPDDFIAGDDDADDSEAWASQKIAEGKARQKKVAIWKASQKKRQAELEAEAEADDGMDFG